MKKVNLGAGASRRQAFVWHITGGWVSTSILILQAFFLIPLYLTFLGDRLYGFWLASGGLLAWVALVDPGAGAITKVRCANAYARKNLKEVVHYFWHGSVIMGCVLALYSLVVFALADAFPRWFDADPALVVILGNCIRLAGIAGALSMANNFLKDFSAALQRTKVPAILQVCSEVVSFSTILVCLVILKWGLWALPLGLLTRNLFAVVGNLVNSWILLRSLPPGQTWSRVIFNDYFRTTPSILAAKASSSFSSNLPNILLTKLLGPESAVAFTVTSRLALVAQQFINNGLAGAYPAYGHLFGDAEVTEQRKIDLVSGFVRGFVFVGGCSVVGYTLLNKGFVGLWTSPEQFVGQWFVGLMALATFMILRSRLLMGMIFSSGAMQSAGYVSSLENILQAALMVAGVSLIGVMGVPAALIVSGILVQFLYQQIINRGTNRASQGLLLLQWAWIPIAVVIGLVLPFSGFFVCSTWAGQALAAIMVSFHLGLIVIFAVPIIRQRFFEVISKTLNFTLGK
ncbi:MAG: lipopolysaccharide biosynthesis protein [Puniceicoccaceae bacterium]